MFRSFIAWLDDYLAGEGPPAMARAVVGILSFAALLGALLGSVAVKAGILVAVLLTLLGMALLLLADRRSLRSSYDAHRNLVSRYCEFISTELRDVPQFASWEHVTAIDKKGNAKETAVIRAKTLHDDLQFIRLSFGCCWDLPQRFRRRVRVNVRHLSVSGLPGTRLPVTLSWAGAKGKLNLIVHFDNAVPSGSELCLNLDWWWPGKCWPLFRGDGDEFVFRLMQQPLVFGRKKIILPPDHDAYYEPIGFVENQTGFLLERSVDDQGRVQFDFECHQLEAGHRAGLRLELKKQASFA
jgi:hypothetical protein